MTEQESNDFYGKDAAELIRRWDSGQTIWSVELGGLGPGYEQAIQTLAVELVRDNLGKELPEKLPEDWGDATVSRLNETCGGFSGAQVGQAKWLAYQWLAKGPADLQRRAKEQKADTIQVSNYWPRATP